MRLAAGIAGYRLANSAIHKLRSQEFIDHPLLAGGLLVAVNYRSQLQQEL